MTDERKELLNQINAFLEKCEEEEKEWLLFRIDNPKETAIQEK